MLHEFITINREEIGLRCRAKVATRSVPPPSDAEINHGVPLFLVNTNDGGGRALHEVGRGLPEQDFLEVDAFNRATDEAVSRVGQEPLFTTNGAGRLRIPILTQTPLPFE